MSEKRCRQIVRDRADEVCERCGQCLPCTLHHRRNRSQLPKARHWEVSNCAMLCGDGVRGCHGWATVNPKAAHEEGWHVKPWEEPAKVPVLYRNRWAYLDEQGGIEWIHAPEPFSSKNAEPF